VNGAKISILAGKSLTSIAFFLPFYYVIIIDGGSIAIESDFILGDAVRYETKGHL
jgi:hypothetical protein